LLESDSEYNIAEVYRNKNYIITKGEMKKPISEYNSDTKVSENNNAVTNVQTLNNAFCNRQQ
jgi:hypothetical protein